jgi:Zn-dependent metalloprotease
MKSLYKIFILTLLIPTQLIIAQKTNSGGNKNSLSAKLKTDRRLATFTIDDKKGTVQFLQFNQSNLPKVAEVSSLLKDYFGDTHTYQLINETFITNDIKVVRYQQYFNGIKIEHATIVLLQKQNSIHYITSEIYTLKKSITKAAALTESSALNKATAFIHASKYMWQEDNMGNLAMAKTPKAELVYINDILNNEGIVLAYKFDIYASEPVSRDYVYVNATNGKVVCKDAIIKHVNANGTAATKYSGSKTITTDFNGTNYRLRRTSPTMLGIETFNMQKLSNYNAAIDFTDNDNNWTAAEYNNANKDNAALDAHWGAQQVYDYWKNIHNRNSYDNAGAKIASYVHYANAYDNAYWNGYFMTYGDGSNVPPATTGFKPLTSLDVCGHEIGHAICSYTSNLTYNKESGAMNEGFSDIWAACLENMVDPGNATYEIFLIGEQIKPTWIKGTNRNALRDMANPNAQGQPDTYGGTNWVSVSPCTPSNANDQCGVHTNSGVLNKWFYILTQGESGTNDIGSVYNVTGIGFSKSEKIAYLTETLLTAGSTYANARTAAITAATTLYGACSPEVIATTNAWYAVGVGAVYSGTCTPAVHFINATSTVTETVLSNACHPTKIITQGVRLDANATQNATLTFNTTGSTALIGKDFDISPASITFNAGTNGTQNVTITIYDDAIVEGNETIVLGYTINANGGTAVAAASNQTHTVTITDDDIVPVIGTTTSGAITLMNENFGTSGGTLPSGWTSGLFSGATNVWTIGTNGTVGTGQGAYITNNTTTKALAYTNTIAADAYLITPLINAANVYGMNFSFNYKCLGEQDNNGFYDYGEVMYSFDGTNFISLPDILQNKTVTTAFSVSLPDSLFGNKSFKLGFRWINDNLAGANPPFTIDDILLNGTQTIKKTQIEGTAGQGKQEYVPATSTVYFYSTADSQLVANITNASVDLNCVTGNVTATGVGQTVVNRNATNYNRSQKVYQFTPAVANTTATYSLTIYLTAAEIAIWGANKTVLKFLKVNDGVNLVSGTIDNTNSVVVTPTINDQLATLGYISYTGNFTGFSQFVLFDNTIALPIKLNSFTGKLVGNDVLLSWQTSTEINTKEFVLEKSNNGVSFSPLYTTTSKGVNGFGSIYTYTDKSPFTGYTYYRLKTLENTGSFTYSNIIKIDLLGKNSFVVAPNPVKNDFSIQFTNTSIVKSITIYDATGRQLQNYLPASNFGNINVDASKIGSGVYFVTLTTVNGEVITQRFIKQ